MRKSVLFVEDNPLLLQMDAAALESDSNRWEVLTAKDGGEALSLLGSKPFDIVVSDLHMPGIDGIQLMTAVHQRYPWTSRIMLSGIQDQEQIARSLNSTHQFLSKPVKGRVLKATLERVDGLDAYLQEPELQALLGHMQTLRVSPRFMLAS
jgi:YesN/AraC family two-component response regulator